jgi:YD repeat-containing protein
MYYDAAGNVVLTIAPEGGETRMGYDPAGHLTSTTDPEGGTRTMTVDDRGQTLETQDALTEVTSLLSARTNRLLRASLTASS